MKKPNLLMLRWAWITVGLLAFSASATLAAERPYNGLAAFEFEDEFYEENGIDTGELLDRLLGQDDRSVAAESPHDDFTDVKILEITGGFDHKGDVLYYTVNAKVMPDSFTDDLAGAKAMSLANAFRAFIFPKADGNPLSPALPNRRQDNIFDTRNGYFGADPLGLWLLAFVSWDGPDVGSVQCQGMMEDLAGKNGRDLDTTPVIKRMSEIEGLEGEGCISLRTRALDGSQGFPWVV